MLLGCTNTCSGRRLVATIGDDNDIQDGTEDTNGNSSDRELQSFDYGTQYDYISCYGEDTAAAFYSYAGGMDDASCKDMILDMRYVLIPLEMEY
jgi:hypothetical protein